MQSAKMKIVVLDAYTLNPGDNPWDAVRELGDLVVHDRTSADQVAERASDARIVLTNKTPLDATALDQLSNLRFISVLATGHNIVDVAAARARGIPVSNVPEYGTNSVAQHVFSLLLHFTQHCQQLDQLVHQGEWARRGDFCFWDAPLVELAGKHMGIVGFGRIGRRVGELAHALGMSVLANDINRNEPPGYEPFAWKPMEALFAESDVVTMHCPQTEENTGLVNRALISKMKRSALFFNASRGGLVNESDLADALNDGAIAGAGLDVLSVEPVRHDNPLLRARNCLITPHVAWATVEARRRLMAVTARNIAAFLEGRPMNVVN
jgi:glycerate dehydrogenase